MQHHHRPVHDRCCHLPGRDDAQARQRTDAILRAIQVCRRRLPATVFDAQRLRDGLRLPGQRLRRPGRWDGRWDWRHRRHWRQRRKQLRRQRCGRRLDGRQLHWRQEERQQRRRRRLRVPGACARAELGSGVAGRARARSSDAAQARMRLAWGSRLSASGWALDARARSAELACVARLEKSSQAGSAGVRCVT